MKIWKFPISTTDLQSVSMPKNAHILCVQIQRGAPMLWAECDEEAERVDRQILIVGTGHSIDQSGARRYIGTYQLHNGDLVFHVYEQGV